MQNTNTKNSIDHVLTSETFRNKEVLKGLLRFLYQAYQDNKKLREIDIACGYFKRDNSFVPGDDTIVRVNMYKLRQLLTNYYTTEGIRDEIKVTIPKGSYELDFHAPVTIDENEKSNTVRFILLVLLVLSLLANLILGLSTSDKHKIDYHPVWQDYNNSDKPVSIILGNPFFYSEYLTDSSLVICRDLAINSPDDINENSGREEISYPYFSMNNVLPLPWIFKALNNAKNVELKALSDVNAEHIKTNNQIFIANINSLGFYESFLQETSISVDQNPRRIILKTSKDTNVFLVPEKNKGYHDDYAFMVKIPGPYNNIITILGDFHSAGNTGIASMLMDQKKMKELNKYVIENFERFPTYFEMLIKVSCFNQTDLKTKIIYFNPLEIEESNTMFFPDMMF